MIKIIKFFNYSLEYLFIPSRLLKRPIYPRNINFPITDNCNSRCVMCDVWKEKGENQITANDLNVILNDKLFSKVKHVGISGGEPTLRKDLLECIGILIASLPKLKTLSITSHGFQYSKMGKLLPEVKKLCLESKVEFKLNLSLDGIEGVHDTVRGIPGAYERVLKTRNIAKELGIPVQFQCTVSKENLYDTPELIHWLNRHKEDYIIRKAVPIARLDNYASMSDCNNNMEEDAYFADLILSKKVLNHTQNPNRRLFYKDLGYRLLNDTQRKAPCYFKREGLVLDAQANLYNCSISEELLGNAKSFSANQIYKSKKTDAIRKQLLKKDCLDCKHDQSGAWNPIQVLIEVIFSKLRFDLFLRASQIFLIVYQHIKIILYKLIAKKEIIQSEARGGACIIGAYGGEHIGDSALLGGVILRTIKKHKINNFYIFSTRPKRTQSWLNKLNIENCNINAVDIKKYKEFLAQSSLLMYGGGPIMDMPVQHTEHLMVAQYALSKSIPFIIEGVGYGPFKSKYSQYISHQLFKSANEVSTRSDYNILNAKVTQDPAFDYFENGEKKLFIKDVAEAVYINKFIKSLDENKKICALNFRPIWHKFLKNNQKQGQHEQHCVKLISQTIIKNKDIQFVFLSYNSDQYGMSDLDEAFAIKDYLRHNYGELGTQKANELLIMSREISPVGMLKIIKECDFVIAMRFHACIFAMAAHANVLGVEYNTRGDGKVERLFKDRQISDKVVNVADLDYLTLNNFLNTSE